MIDQPPPKGPLPEDRPSRIQPRIKSAPKIRQLYWCDFPKDAQLPEMWKTRPVLVVSHRNTLHGPCLVVPISTAPQEGDSARWAVSLSISMTGQESWAVCNHLYTVAPSRLSSNRGPVPRLSDEEFNKVLERVADWLPKRPS